MMGDLDDLADIAEQNRMTAGRSDGRGQKRKLRGIPLFRNQKIRHSRRSKQPVTLSGSIEPTQKLPAKTSAPPTANNVPLELRVQPGGVSSSQTRGLGTIMTGRDIREARATLGKLWGLDRPLHASELARALRLKGRDPGATVLSWEAGTPVSGPVSVAVEDMIVMLQAGIRPQSLREALR